MRAAAEAAVACGRPTGMSAAEEEGQIASSPIFFLIYLHKHPLLAYVLCIDGM
jgi:hypothetical protein